MDFRSLALLRIAVGFVVLVDLIMRFQHATVLYSDAGVLTRTSALSGLSPFRWSILFSNGTSQFVNAVFLFGIVAAVAMILGWKTRMATVVLWIIVFSFQTRNYHLSSGADTLIRITLFWAMLMPLGRMWSLDAVRSRANSTSNGSGKSSKTIASLATFGFLFQIACVYAVTATLKSGPRWREEGTALYYALGARDVSSGLGNWIFRSAPDLMLTAATYGTLLMEFAVPILLLLPLRSGWLRSLGILLVISLHLGIMATMTVGLFPAISIAGVIGLLPTWFWDKVVARSTYPGLAERLRSVFSRVVDRTRPLIPQPSGSATLVSTYSGKSETSQIRDRRALHFIHTPQVSRGAVSRIASNTLSALVIVLVLGLNVQTVTSYTLPQPVRNLSVSSGLYQHWGMFAPGPQMSSVWFVVDGELSSGEHVDVLLPLYDDDLDLREPVVWDQSDELVLQDKYWRKYFNSIRDREAQKRGFAAYTCRTWNAQNSGEDRLERVTLTRAFARTLPNGMRDEPVYDQLGSWDCA